MGAPKMGEEETAVAEELVTMHVAVDDLRRGWRSRIPASSRADVPLAAERSRVGDAVEARREHIDELHHSRTTERICPLAPAQSGGRWSTGTLLARNMLAERMVRHAVSRRDAPPGVEVARSISGA